MPTFFDGELEGVAVFWRIYRCDGFTLGLTSHDKALYFAGITHRAAPGIVPSAIRKTIGLEEESAEVQGALSHQSINEKDLSAGLYDGAWIEIGAVNWESLNHTVLYAGAIGEVREETQSFAANLSSAKRKLERDLVAYTSPTCRAEFCGPGCGLSAARFSREVRIDEVDFDSNGIACSQLDGALLESGRVTFLEGPQTGLTFTIISSENSILRLDRPLHPDIAAGLKVRVREGCDHTHSTCHSRFDNAVNFRGEPFLPGNDLLTRYPKPQ
ncbi:DUF2163 domain-containing protein [Erythrobacter sp. HA6-11]